MRRIACIMVVLACAFAQTYRDAYRDAYRAWRQGDPNLERDAGSAGAELAPRAERVAAQAAKYAGARAEFLQQAASAEEQRLSWLETPPDAPSAMIDENASALIAGESRNLKRNIDGFANDADPGIKELRAMMERENAALVTLGAAIDQRRRAAEEVKSANASVAESQLKAAEQYQAVEDGLRQAGADTGAESLAWADYYRLLADGARGVSAAAIPNTAAAPGSPAAPAPFPARPAPKAAITPLPLIRYTGAWTFPLANGMFHGARPEFVDLVVHEQDGHADGTLFARFTLPAGSPGDPVVRFDFSGDFQNTRNQVFNLVTSDGAKGTIELIPGPAFNLLEVNFQTDPKPGKVRQGNFVLVKK